MTIIVNSVGDAALLLTLVFGIFVFSFGSSFYKKKHWYETGKQYVKGTPPNWLFGIIWPMLYILLISSVYNYLTTEVPGIHYDVFCFSTAFLVTLLNAWFPIFFKSKKIIFALVVLMLIVAFCVIMMVISAIDEKWISFGCLIPLLLWLVYATYLNAAWVFVIKKYREELVDGESYMYDENANASCNYVAKNRCDKRVIKT